MDDSERFCAAELCFHCQQDSKPVCKLSRLGLNPLSYLDSSITEKNYKGKEGK